MGNNESKVSPPEEERRGGSKRLGQKGRPPKNEQAYLGNGLDDLPARCSVCKVCFFFFF